LDRPRRQRRRGRPRRPGQRRPSDDGHNGQSALGATLPELLDLTPFSVFCALYLGITETDDYQSQDERAVARRFGVSEPELRDFLEANGLSGRELALADFDLQSAQLDIKVAPEGISRTELARTLFEELCEVTGRTDWSPSASSEP
jgi:hypothetical protein